MCTHLRMCLLLVYSIFTFTSLNSLHLNPSSNGPKSDYVCIDVSQTLPPKSSLASEDLGQIGGPDNKTAIHPRLRPSLSRPEVNLHRINFICGTHYGSNALNYLHLCISNSQTQSPGCSIGDGIFPLRYKGTS